MQYVHIPQNVHGLVRTFMLDSSFALFLSFTDGLFPVVDQDGFLAGTEVKFLFLLHGMDLNIRVQYPLHPVDLVLRRGKKVSLRPRNAVRISHRSPYVSKSR